MKARHQIAFSLAGIMSLVIIPALALAQYTAPLPTLPKEKTKVVPGNIGVTPPEKAPEIVKVLPGNPENVAPGFYATYKPQSYDTVYVYEGGSEEFVSVSVHSGNEVIRGDSADVIHDVDIRMNHFNGEGIPISSEKAGKSNSIVIRSGVIPAQGLGSNRFRFAVKPTNFKLTSSSMISASVHMKPENNIGNILCVVSKIDYVKGIFYVEASNEIPLGESINWIIINTPESPKADSASR